MSRILITGGAGFIGAHVAKQLNDRGDEILLVDDFNDRYDPALKEQRIAHLVPDLATNNLARLDIVQAHDLDNAVSTFKPDVVVHLAAWAAVQRSIEDPHIYARANVEGTVNVLEAARKHDVSHVIFASSSSVYGGRTTVPFKESDDVSKPISPYAATKVAGEALCATWHSLYGLPITALRFFTVYGPWGRPEMAYFSFTEAIAAGREIEMRGKDTERDFTYIDDIVSGVVAATDAHPSGYEIYNLGNKDGVPLPRFIAAIEQALGTTANIREVPLPPGDVPRTFADISKAQKAFGYTPSTSIEDGMKKFVQWYTETQKQP